jgi:hypothetical protein
VYEGIAGLTLLLEEIEEVLEVVVLDEEFEVVLLDEELEVILLDEELEVFVDVKEEEDEWEEEDGVATHTKSLKV